MAVPRRARGFTLVELLVVITIILLVTVVALPTVVSSIEGRQVRAAARLLQGQLAGCRDRAIHDGAPSGIRLLPDPAWPVARLPSGQVDPAYPLAYSRMVPVGPAPEYVEGRVSVFPGAAYPPAVRTVNGYPGCPCLVVEEAARDARGLPNPPTSWYWNIRVGERIRPGGSGPWYTIVGPIAIGPADGNAELFVNIGQPGTRPPTLQGGAPCEYLLLVNGRDDDANGWVDEGFDGVDNDGVEGVDEHEPSKTVRVDGQAVVCDEWEVEGWLGGAARGLSSAPYAIRRRAAPLPGARELALPTQVVIDATTWGTTRERSRLPVNPWTGEVELLIGPDGTATYSLPYGVPSSVGMDAAWLHFWLAERQDVAAPSGMTAPLLPVSVDAAEATGTAAAGTIEGSYGLISLSVRSGRVATVEAPPFLAGGRYSPSAPSRGVEQGVTD